MWSVADVCSVTTLPVGGPPGRLDAQSTCARNARGEGEIMAEHGFRFGETEYEVHIRAHPFSSGGATAYTATVYRVDGHELQTISDDEITASSEEAAVNRAFDYLKKESGVDGAPFDLPDRKSSRVIRPVSAGN